MNKFFRVISTSALAVTLVSSGLQPITSFAEEQEIVDKQENNVFVTKLVNSNESSSLSLGGFKSLSPSYPAAPVPDLLEALKGWDMSKTLPSDTKKLQRGLTTISGSLLDYIPVDIYDDNVNMLEKAAAVMPDVELLNPNFTYHSDDNPIFFGFVDNNGEYNEYIHFLWNQVPDKKGKLGTLMLNPDVLPADDDSSLILDAYYERIGNAVTNYSGESTSFSKTYTTGVTKSKSRELSNTIGASYGFEIGFGDIATVTAEISTELTESFGSSIDVENSHEVSYSYNFGERFDDPYTYAIYHLEGDYKLVPSQQLKEIVDSLQQIYLIEGGIRKRDLNTTVGETSFPYPTDDYRAVEVYENGFRIPAQNLLDQYSINDFTDSNWSKHNVSIGYGSETTPEGDSAQKLTQKEVNGAVQQYVDVASDGNQYTFGVWLKADEPHQAQIKVQNRNNTESASVKVDVTTDWEYFSVTTDQPFSTNDGITVVIWPSVYNGPTDSVYVWEPKLIEE
ncbi:phage head spike fiber domain-containing protein [Cytobacillus sp. Hm23]